MKITCDTCTRLLGSKRKAIEEGKCDFCYKPANICLQTLCNKKVMINGYCSTHVSLGRSTQNTFSPIKTSTEENALREERRSLKMELFSSPRVKREEKINNIRNAIPYDPIDAQFHYRLLEKLINENEFYSEIEMGTLEDTIRKFREKFSDIGGVKRKLENSNFETSKRKKTSSPISHDELRGRSYSWCEQTPEKRDRPGKELNFVELEAFGTLGIDPTTNMLKIKVAFLKLAIQNNPDRNFDEDTFATFSEINKAYSYLSDKYE